MGQSNVIEFVELDIDIQQQHFYRKCLLDINDVLEQIIGTEESGAFVGLVANRLADFFMDAYRASSGHRRYSTTQLANLLVDLKRRIGGDFYIESVCASKIVLRNRRCPFGKEVVGNTAMCNMTAGVFGKIVAESQNYAAVSIDEAIAHGDKQCQITILLDLDENLPPNYKEFFNV